MKIFRMVVFLLSIVTGIFYFIQFGVYGVKTNGTYPSITSDRKVIEVSIMDKDKLFEGLSAHDDKDGDVTDKILIENVSKFLEKGVCNITYAVCDSDNNVSKLTRKVKYTDYESPRFQIDHEPQFYIGSTINMEDFIKCYCLIDGDISNKIKYDIGNLTTNVPGVYTVNAKVTNSKGDVVDLSFEVVVRERNVKTPKIKLESYVLYVNTGEEVNPKDYIQSVTGIDGLFLDISHVNIYSDLDTSKPGEYKIYYSVSEGAETYTTSMVCVVEEGNA
ncbi:MAG TPA: DUF5011 domain-containing protein [Clostridiaceae bacterium]|nr:DUF5011 domain-containing protein [Clostridiaceae bacterium]